MAIKYGLIIQGQGRTVPLQGVDVRVSVQGFLANVEASLQYINDSDTETLEVVYVFPMDDNSAVYKLEANIDGRNITAEVQEKQQVGNLLLLVTYEEAVSSGRSAVLMEEHDTSGDIFRCKLGNLPPKSKADIKFSFVTEMSLETDGSLKFVLPTVLNPRYNPSLEDGGSKEDTSFSAMNQCHYDLTFKGSVNSQHGISRVWSESDELRTSLVDAVGNINIMEFQLDGPPKLDHDISFHVLYENCHKPQTTLEKGAQDKEGLMRKDLLMLSFYPDLSSSTTSGSAEFIFIIDRSGSMDGESIQSAKEAMLFFLKSLPVDCFFNIISFGSSYKALFPGGSMQYKEGTLNQAMNLQAHLRADMGGTEILRPLEFVYRKKAQAGYPRQIFLLTDGGVSNAGEVVSLVKRNSYDSRVFTVGIGAGVSTTLVRNVAKAGGGEAEFVTDSLNLQQKVMKLLKAACQPAATDIALDLDLPSGLTVDLMLPKDVPVIFSGRRASIFVFLSGKAATSEGKAHMSGKISRTSFNHSMEFDLQTDAQVNSGQFIHRMAMKGLIKDLEMEEIDSNGEKKREIILASTASNLVSKYTSFVGVDKERNEKITEAVTCHVAPPPRSYAAPPLSRSMGRRQLQIPLRRLKGSFSGPPAPPPSRRRGAPPPSRSLAASPPPPPPPSSQYVMADLCAGEEDYDSCCTVYEADTDLCAGDIYEETDDIYCTFDGSDTAPPPPLRPLPPARPTAQSKGNQMFSSQAGEMVMLQAFDGSWKLDSQLSKLINVTTDNLLKATGIKDKKVLATCAAVCWLTLKCSEERSVLEMVVDKAKQWLLKTLGDQKEVDKLMEEVREAFIKN